MLTIRFELIYFFCFSNFGDQRQKQKRCPRELSKVKSSWLSEGNNNYHSVCVLLKDFWKYRQIKINAKLIKIQFISGSLLYEINFLISKNISSKKETRNSPVFIETNSGIEHNRDGFLCKIH